MYKLQKPIVVCIKSILNWIVFCKTFSLLECIWPFTKIEQDYRGFFSEKEKQICINNKNQWLYVMFMDKSE